MKALVLGGCGAMGSETTHDLARSSKFAEIMVADVDEPKAEAFVQSLGDPRFKAMAIDVTDVNALVALFTVYDIVINCTSYKFGLGITEAAIGAKRNMLDLGGLYNTPKQLAMDDQARAAGVTILLGCGATPGVTNLMAKRGAEQMDVAEEVHVAFATFRAIAPSPGLLDTVMDEFAPGTKRFYYQDGEFVEVAPFEGEKRVEFSAPVGAQNTYYVPHSETRTLPLFLGKGLRRVDVRGCWRPETMANLRTFNDLGLLETEPKAFLRQFFLDHSASTDDGEWAFLVNVEVVGRRGPKVVRATYNLSHPPKSEWAFSCTAKVTGIPASIGAQLLAGGRANRPGVVACEACFDPQEFFAELAKRQIHVHERIVEERRYSGQDGQESALLRVGHQEPAVRA